MMLRSLSLLIIGLFFGGGLGFLLAASNGITLDGHDHDTPNETQMLAHNHSQTLDLPTDGTAPTVKIALHKDAASGWNLQLTTANFRFAPEHASQDNVTGEGHAHVYINDQKLARLYSKWMHINELPKGQVQVSVSLYANDHSALKVGTQRVSDAITLTVE